MARLRAPEWRFVLIMPHTYEYVTKWNLWRRSWFMPPASRDWRRISLTHSASLPLTLRSIIIQRGPLSSRPPP